MHRLTPAEHQFRATLTHRQQREFDAALVCYERDPLTSLRLHVVSLSREWRAAHRDSDRAPAPSLALHYHHQAQQLDNRLSVARQVMSALERELQALACAAGH